MCLPLRHFKCRWCVEEVGVWFLSYAIWLYLRKNFNLFDFCSKGLMPFVCCPFSVLSVGWFGGFRLISQCLVRFLNWIATKLKKKKKVVMTLPTWGFVTHECPHLSIWRTSSFLVAGVIHLFNVNNMHMSSAFRKNCLFCLASSPPFSNSFC